MNKVIIIAGPTAVGKTSLSIDLAKKLNTEIISSDSMQIFKGMDIGTAKVTQDEMEGVVHHLIDIKSPNDSFSVQEFQALALDLIDKLHSQGKIPIIVGGTGLYIDSLVYDYDFVNVKPDYKLRADLESQYKNDPQSILDRVLSIDSNLYGHLNIKDMKKLIRAIEVYELAGKKIEYKRTSSDEVTRYSLYVLNDDRDDLYARINSRIDTMLDQGLIEEVRTLLANGANKDSQAMKAIGYREVLEYLDEKISYEELVDKLKQNSRRYAKRQLTWFRRNEYSQWIDINTISRQELIHKIIKENSVN